MKIKHMIVILFIFLSVIPMTISGLANMYHYNDKLKQLLENDLRMAVSTQVKAIENFYQERSADAAVISDNQLLRDFLEACNYGRADQKRQLGEYVNDILFFYISGSEYVDDIAVIDTEYRVVASSEPDYVGDESELKSLSGEYIGPELRFTHVIEVDGRKTVLAVQEIKEDEETLGYVIQLLNLSFFEDVRNSARLYNNGTIYILDGRGGLVAAGDTEQRREQYVLDEQERGDFNRAWEGRDTSSKEGFLRYRILDNNYISCYSYIDHTEWRIISSVNLDEVLRIREGYRELLVMLLVELAIVLIMGHLLIHLNIARPVTNMIQTFGRIRETQDYRIRMHISSRNEIGVISEEINSLLTDMEHYVERERQEQELLKARAEKDPMTGLFHKEAMGRIMRRELEEAQKESENIAFLFLDVDDFKACNTQYGHLAADHILCHIARVLETHAGGMAGRQGGDEFSACFRGFAGREGLERVVGSISEELRRGIELEAGCGCIAISCSIGVAYGNHPGLTYEELIENADRAMYQVKHSGKNGYHINYVSFPG